MISREAFRGEALLYAGHGSGAKYFSHESMLGQRGAPLGLLMGCSSARMGLRGEAVRAETPLYYLVLRAPVVVGETRGDEEIGCLWDVSDGDLDRVTRVIVDALAVGEREGLEVDERVGGCV